MLLETLNTLFKKRTTLEGKLKANMIFQKVLSLITTFFLLISNLSIIAQSITPVLNYQGRVNIDLNGKQTTYSGAVGYFKFAIINFNKTISYWSNDGTSQNGSEPETSLSVAFPNGDGVFSVSLGGGSMEPLNAHKFSDPNTLLRVWFSSDDIEFEELKPNERFSIVPYAFRAQVADAVSPGALIPDQLSNQFSGMTMVSDDPNDKRLESMGFARYAKMDSAPWFDINRDLAPLPLTGHSAVVGVLGSKLYGMYIWGGTPGKGNYPTQGWLYNFDGDYWSLLSSADAPSGRVGHTAVWADTNMIIWGGVGESGYLSNGGVYSSSTLSWESIPALRVQFFSPRQGHTAVWTESEMLIWGGRNQFDQMNDGVAYNSTTEKWRLLSSDHNLSARTEHTAIWTGSEMLIWGGKGRNGFLSDGAAYDPSTDKWREISNENKPNARSGHTAIWTGIEMLIWGGKTEGFSGVNVCAYNPQKDQWRIINAQGGPEPREGHTANWTGSEMVIFGGQTSIGAVNTGFALDPQKNKWRSLTTSGNPMERAMHTAVWTGSDLVVFGGLKNGAPLSSPQRVNLGATWYLYRKL